MTKLAINGGLRTLEDSIKTKWPIITETDKDAVLRVLDSGILWGFNAPEMRALEKEFSAYVGSNYCIAVNSGTAALHCAVSAAKLGPGDEVITSAFSFAASALSVLHHNALPIFVDIDPDTYNINVREIEDKITPQTKAIIPVHIHGCPADMDEINKIAHKHNLVVIEDACQSPGSIYKGKKTGTLGDMGAFSLNTTKNLSGGEGGLLVTDSEEYRGKANMLRMFGEFVQEGEGRKYQSFSMGWNYRTQEMPCAFTRSQLKRLDDYNRVSKNNASYLNKELTNIEGVKVQVIPEYCTSCYHKYRIRLDWNIFNLNNNNAHIFREKIRQALIAEGVEAVLWQSTTVPGQPVFNIMEGYGKGCPWNCQHVKNKYKYRNEDYPETVKLLKDSMLIGSETYPLCSSDIKVMEKYIEAFNKVFSNLDEVNRIDLNKIEGAFLDGTGTS